MHTPNPLCSIVIPVHNKASLTRQCVDTLLTQQHERADVEIIVDKVPNAISVPTQAVFEKEGKLVVYVKSAGVFEPRFIKPLKRSESVMIIAEGVQPGDVIALTDPTAKKNDKKSDRQQKGGGAMGALPGGGK